jgi:hypothetical protein
MLSTTRTCCQALSSVRFAVLLVIGKQTPPRSAAEMGALAKVISRPPLLLDGSLGLHEEHATALVPPFASSWQLEFESRVLR